MLDTVFLYIVHTFLARWTLDHRGAYELRAYWLARTPMSRCGESFIASCPQESRS
jgi:hypothetical protein